MKQKRILSVLAVAAALGLPGYVVCAAQDAPGEVKSYGTVIYEENGSQARLYGEDIALLAQKVSSIPETVFDAALYSTPGNVIDSTLLPQTYVFEEAECEVEMQYQSEPDGTDETEESIEAVDADNAEEGGSETNVENEIEAGDEDGAEDETEAGNEDGTENEAEVSDGADAEDETDVENDTENEEQVNDSISSNTIETE